MTMTTLRHDILVVDASIGYRLLIPNQEQTTLESTLTRWMETGIRLAAPTLWRYEVTSTITKSFQQAQITLPEAKQAFEASQKFPIELIAPSNELARAAFTWTLKLKRAAAYDSFYLALAEQLQCELWTYDQRLANAVSQPWVRHLGPAT